MRTYRTLILFTLLLAALWPRLSFAQTGADKIRGDRLHRQ